jgi:hypothetical protein
MALALTQLSLAASNAAAEGKAAETARRATSHPNFSGVWDLASLDLEMTPDQSHPKYTPQALAGIEYWQKHFNPDQDDPTRVCFLKGMPWTMINRARNYPTEIDQTDKRIFMFFELYDQARNIHFDATAVPDEFPPSAQGFSYAHWEGNTLVIETGGLTAINPIGIYHRSDQAHITERWQLKKDSTYGEIIDIDITDADPEVYLEPARAHHVYKRAPAGVVVGGYNCSGSLWEDYVQARIKDIESQSK